MKWWTSERNWGVCGKMAMILISQMCEIGSVTVDECILGKFRYKCSKMKNRQKGIFFWIQGKKNFYEAKWSWHVAILIVNYFTNVIWSLLRGLTWEESKPSLNKEDRIPIKQISSHWRTEDTGNFELYCTNAMVRLH